VKRNYDVCEATNSLQGCSNKCWKFKANKRPYTTLVDMEGFKIGDGAYSMLLGINIIQAIGALALYLFLLGFVRIAAVNAFACVHLCNHRTITQAFLP
jgi:hypothetical protein